MRVAAFQFDVRQGDVAHNVGEVERGLRGAAGDGAELVVLPEMWPTSFVPEGVESAAGGWLAETDAAVEQVARLSRELGIVVCGSAFGAPADTGVPPGAGADTKPRNRLVIVERGREILSYDKVHLFSPTAEHLVFSRGKTAPGTVDCRGMKLSGVVCYDLRFAAVLRAPFVDEAELLVVPAQWPIPRISHWSALAIGRAVEHQAFVVATNRTGRVQVGRRGMELEFPGRSVIVSPHGEVLAEGGSEPGWIVADIDPEVARALRKRVPVRADERDPALDS